MSEAKYLKPQDLRGELSLAVPMSRYTSWRAGGLAERMYRPADLDDLKVFLGALPVDEPLYVIGLGSNLLVRDGGLRGTALLLHGALNGLHLAADGLVYAEAGAPGAKLARFAAKHHLRGAEFMAAIPGTIGGMLAMNAGCYGSEIWQKVMRVQVLDRSGVLHERTPLDYEIGYRSVLSKSPCGDLLFAAAWLKFEQGDATLARQEIKQLLSKRTASQPLHLPNAGSVFRNPPNDYAARLIEQCGLKGRRIGGAQVSEKHANFIVNIAGASATDIENLIIEVQATVFVQTGIKLHLEVKIIGEQAS